MRPQQSYKLCVNLIDKYNINLTGLTILTEAASGVYMYNPMILILAGAKRVLTFCRGSRFGSVKQVETFMRSIYGAVGLNERYEFITDLTNEHIGSADIVTNSGHLRPIDAVFIEQMKATAVLPLMWEPWELRPGEIAIEAAKRRGILVLGTNEHQAPCDMRSFNFLTALHLAMNHGAPIVDDRVLIIGDQYLLAHAIAAGFKQISVQCRCLPAHTSRDTLLDALKWATYVIVAEHLDKRLIFGPGGIIKADELVSCSIHCVGVVSGHVDRDNLEAAGISVFPKKIAPAGFLSYMPSSLGPYPVMDLFAAGTKVGQVMARARLAGLNVVAAARSAVANSPALDLEGDLSWI